MWQQPTAWGDIADSHADAVGNGRPFGIANPVPIRGGFSNPDPVPCLFEPGQRAAVATRREYRVRLDAV